MRMNDKEFQDILIASPPDVRVSQDTQVLTIATHDKRVKLSQETIEQYRRAIDRGKPDVKWWQRVAAFLSASNKAGRKAKVIKDAVLIFFPWGKQISNITEFITHIFIKDMARTEETKPVVKSKTIITFTLLALVGILSKLGIDLGLELSPDAEWVAIAAGIVGNLLRLVTGQAVALFSKE